MADTSAYISELDALAEELSAVGAEGDSPEFREPYSAARREIDRVEKSWSGSNLGYQARVYYGEFEPPPANEAFSITSGLRRGGVSPTRWRVRGADDVRDELRACGVSIDFDELTAKETEVRRLITRHKGTITSILSSYLATHGDNYIVTVKDRVEKISPPNAATFARALVPNRQYLTNDTRALNEGGAIAPHQQILGQLEAAGAPYLCALELSECARSAADHLRRAPNAAPAAIQVQLGSRVFIGHGRSQQWRELKDFLQDRLGLHIDEFNRVPVAGTTTAARLSDMLNNAAFACLVMTAEDEMADGTKVARDNVIHEVGLFQGRLGFERAIVLLEERCEEG